MIIMFIGPSSSGKDTFFKETKEKYNLDNIILHTTRPIRNNEIDGENYYFVTKEKLDEMDKNNLLIERRDYNTIHGIWSYATSKLAIDNNKDYITLNTWDGYKKFIEYFGKDYIKPFYFELDDGIRLERAIEREKKQDEPKYQELCRRYLADINDFSKKNLCLYRPYMIDNNGTIEDTLKQIDEGMKLILKR